MCSAGSLNRSGVNVPMRPNVRAKRATTAGRQARTGEKCTAYHRTGPGGLPLTLRLSEGLGVAFINYELVKFWKFRRDDLSAGGEWKALERATPEIQSVQIFSEDRDEPRFC